MSRPCQYLQILWQRRGGKLAKCGTSTGWDVCSPCNFIDLSEISQPNKVVYKLLSTLHCKYFTRDRGYFVPGNLVILSPIVAYCKLLSTTNTTHKARRKPGNFIAGRQFQSCKELTLTLVQGEPVVLNKWQFEQMVDNPIPLHA